jgi:hypothetical protein
MYGPGEQSFWQSEFNAMFLTTTCVLVHVIERQDPETGAIVEIEERDVIICAIEPMSATEDRKPEKIVGEWQRNARASRLTVEIDVVINQKDYVEYGGKRLEVVSVLEPDNHGIMKSCVVMEVIH